MDNVYCYGSETSILDCNYDFNTGADTHYEDVGIKCLIGKFSFFPLFSEQGFGSSLFCVLLIFINLGNQCAHGDARLVNGSVSSEGRLEVCVDGIWGTVSSFLITPNAARVVCRQLGYSDQGRANTCLLYCEVWVYI